jgi:hypothetical protein
LNKRIKMDGIYFNVELILNKAKEILSTKTDLNFVFSKVNIHKLNDLKSIKYMVDKEQNLVHKLHLYFKERKSKF